MADNAGPHIGVIVPLVIWSVRQLFWIGSQVGEFMGHNDPRRSLLTAYPPVRFLNEKDLSLWFDATAQIIRDDQVQSSSSIPWKRHGFNLYWCPTNLVETTIYVFQALLSPTYHRQLLFGKLREFMKSYTNITKVGFLAVDNWHLKNLYSKRANFTNWVFERYSHMFEMRGFNFAAWVSVRRALFFSRQRHK